MKNKKWVLIVEDEEDIRDLIKLQLETKIGDTVGVIAAVDGLDATRRLPFQAFDCIITDLNMPRKEGGEFIKSARASLLNEKTPIIIVSGNPDPEIEESFDYVYQFTKPIDFKGLIAHVKTQLKLGNTSKRLNANIINTAIQSVQKFSQQRLGVECQVGKPVSKLLNTAIDYNVNIFKSVELVINKGRVKITFMVQSSFFTFLKNKSEIFREYEDIKSMLPVLAKLLVKPIVSSHDVDSGAQLVNSNSFNSNNKEKLHQLYLAKGIIVPIDIEEQAIYIFAEWF